VIPKNLFIMWNKPRDQWPLLVTFCVDLWIKLNPEFNIEIYDSQKAIDFIKEDFDLDIYQKLKVQHQSDILRTKLLAERGGIWVDATCMPHRPVRLWIDSFEGVDFAGLKTLTQGQTIDNWFMISRQSSTLMKKQYVALQGYWKTPKIYLPQDPESIAIIAENWQEYVTDFMAHKMRLAPYFIWQYLFTSLVASDTEFAELFKTQKYSSSDGGCGFVAMTLARHAGTTSLLPEIREHIIYSAAPLSKLIRWNPDTEKLIDELRLCVEHRGAIEGF
jgi:hypothetical protein